MNQDSSFGWVNTRSGNIPVGKDFTENLPSAFSFSGSPNIGTKTIGITKTGNGSFAGFNLIGNPYSAALNLEKFLQGNGNISGTIYLWNPQLQDYEPKNLGTGDANFGIASMQGFFVQSKNQNGIVTFNHGMRVPGNNTSFFREAADEVLVLN